MVAHSRLSVRWLVPLMLLFSACTARPSPSPLPEAPSPPDGWTSLGSIGGIASEGRTGIRLTFNGRPVAVNTTCRGTGTLFVIVDWNEVLPNSGPAEFSTAAFPCRAPIEGVINSRLELTSAPNGEAEINVFVLEGVAALERAQFAVSIEERNP